MNFITEYWEQFAAFLIIEAILVRMRVDVEVLKDKVKTLFELWNKKEK